jgi:hypothetical protein
VTSGKTSYGGAPATGLAASWTGTARNIAHFTWTPPAGATPTGYRVGWTGPPTGGTTFYSGDIAPASFVDFYDLLTSSTYTFTVAPLYGTTVGRTTSLTYSTPVSTGANIGGYTIADVNNLTAADRAAVAARLHGVESVWNKPIAQRVAADQQVVHIQTASGHDMAWNFAVQAKMDSQHFEDHIKGYYDDRFQVAINTDDYSIPVYVVPANQPLQRVNYYDAGGSHPLNADDAVNGLGGAWAQVPLPTESQLKPGNNGFTVKAPVAVGDTTIRIDWYNGYGDFILDGESFRLTGVTPISGSGDYLATTNKPGGFAQAHASGAKSTRAHQYEANGNDKSLVILQPQADGSIKLWEFWVFHPDGRKTSFDKTTPAAAGAPGSGVYSAWYGGYLDDTRKWNGIWGKGWGMRAAGMSAFGGSITLADIQGGKITHALNVAPYITGTTAGSQWLAPANRWDGFDQTIGVAAVDDGGDYGRHRLPLGAYFRLDPVKWPDTAVDSWVDAHPYNDSFVGAMDPAVAKMIYKAMRDYGVYLTDTAGAFTFYAESAQSRGTVYSVSEGSFPNLGQWWHSFPWYDMQQLAPSAGPIDLSPVTVPLTAADGPLPAALPGTFDANGVFPTNFPGFHFSLVSNKARFTVSKTGDPDYGGGTLSIKTALVPALVNIRIKGTITVPGSGVGALAIVLRSVFTSGDPSSGAGLGVKFDGDGTTRLFKLTRYSKNPFNFNDQPPANAGSTNTLTGLTGTRRFEVYANGSDLRFRSWPTTQADPTTDTTWDMRATIGTAYPDGPINDPGQVAFHAYSGTATQQSANGTTFELSDITVTPIG